MSRSAGSLILSRTQLCKKSQPSGLYDHGVLHYTLGHEDRSAAATVLSRLIIDSIKNFKRFLHI
jgi:hypothetical protein